MEFDPKKFIRSLLVFARTQYNIDWNGVVSHELGSRAIHEHTDREITQAQAFLNHTLEVHLENGYAESTAAEAVLDEFNKYLQLNHPNLPTDISNERMDDDYQSLINEAVQEFIDEEVCGLHGMMCDALIDYDDGELDIR